MVDTKLLFVRVLCNLYLLKFMQSSFVIRSMCVQDKVQNTHCKFLRLQYDLSVWKFPQYTKQHLHSSLEAIEGNYNEL